MNIFEVFISNNEEVHTRKGIPAKILNVSYMITNPKNRKPRDLSLTPISIMVAGTTGTFTSRKKIESEDLVDLGTVELQATSERALPTFGIQQRI